MPASTFASRQHCRLADRAQRAEDEHPRRQQRGSEREGDRDHLTRVTPLGARQERQRPEAAQSGVNPQERRYPGKAIAIQ